MEDHPLVTWYATLLRSGAVRVEGTDIVLGDLGGKRFGLAVAKAGEPVLCVQKDDLPALRSVKWTSAAMAFGHKGRDWIALSCKDIRVKGSGEMNPVPLRLWIPVTEGRLDAWKEVSPKRLLIAPMKTNGKGRGISLDSTERLAEVPMKMIGA